MVLTNLIFYRKYLSNIYISAEYTIEVDITRDILTTVDERKIYKLTRDDYV